MSVYSNEHLEPCHKNKRNLVRLKRGLLKGAFFISELRRTTSLPTVCWKVESSQINAFLIVSSSIIAVGQYCMILLWM